MFAWAERKRQEGDEFLYPKAIFLWQTMRSSPQIIDTTSLVRVLVKPTASKELQLPMDLATFLFNSVIQPLSFYLLFGPFRSKRHLDNSSWPSEFLTSYDCDISLSPKVLNSNSHVHVTHCPNELINNLWNFWKNIDRFHFFSEADPRNSVNDDYWIID